MAKPMTTRELKRLSREMSGHRRDKDRARRSRRLAGVGPVSSRRPRPPTDGVLEDLAGEEPEPEET